jgi:hypothetical protein
MNDIKEITNRLLPVIDAVITLTGKYRILEPLKDVTSGMQLAIYWFKTAERELEAVQTSETLSTEEVQSFNSKAPTLLGTVDYFNYINTKLGEVNKELWQYKESTEFPPQVKYQLDRGYDKLMDSKFNIQLAEMYYETLSKGK